ncbi:collagen binding domain-containing protein, partial [Streptomyces sp. NPDC001552]|uniref:MSCRAMM family protein n=1 Tax=Streptomyces sp. NPDC001552 TaxID=3364587 RepID=UPI003698B6E3
MTIRKKDPEGTRLVGAAFQLLDSDGKQVAAGRTDEQGSLGFDKLPAGTYRLHETSSGSPVHDLVPEQTITITAGRTAQANPLDLVDPFKKARLSVRKTDKNTGKTLPGAVVAIRADETDKTGKRTPGMVITSLTTGTDGTATVPLDVTLKAGTRYWAGETKAPEGYQLDPTPVVREHLTSPPPAPGNHVGGELRGCALAVDERGGVPGGDAADALAADGVVAAELVELEGTCCRSPSVGQEGPPRRRPPVLGGARHVLRDLRRALAGVVRRLLRIRRLRRLPRDHQEALPSAGLSNERCNRCGWGYWRAAESRPSKVMSNALR